MSSFVFQLTIKETNETLQVSSDSMFYNEAYFEVLSKIMLERKIFDPMEVGIKCIKKPYKLSDLADEPFGCCGSWKLCDMGKMPCVHETSDPAYAQLCSCFKRNKKPGNKKVEDLFFFDEAGQGTLFG